MIKEPPSLPGVRLFLFSVCMHCIFFIGAQVSGAPLTAPEIFLPLHAPT